jgi:hypothetical protein
MSTQINVLQQVEMTSLTNAISTAVGTDPTSVTGATLAGYTPVSGTVTSTDTILEGIEKLDGNITEVKNGDIIIIDGGNSTN